LKGFKSTLQNNKQYGKLDKNVKTVIENFSSTNINFKNDLLQAIAAKKALLSDPTIAPEKSVAAPPESPKGKTAPVSAPQPNPQPPAEMIAKTPPIPPPPPTGKNSAIAPPAPKTPQPEVPAQPPIVPGDDKKGNGHPPADPLVNQAAGNGVRQQTQRSMRQLPVRKIATGMLVIAAVVGAYYYFWIYKPRKIKGQEDLQKNLPKPEPTAGEVAAAEKALSDA
jgi:hypothetical protein